jgi:hypothetical protein
MNAQERHEKRLDEMEREHKEMEAATKMRLKDAASMGPEYAESVRLYLAANGRKGGKISRRKLTKKQALEMVKAREAKRQKP